MGMTHRDLIHKAVIGARDVMDGVMTDINEGSKLTDDELLKRYTSIHRGNPRAMSVFVKQNAPPGADLMKSWRSYESTMEKKLAERGGKMTVPGYLGMRK